MSTHDEQAFTDALRIQAVGAGTPALTLDDVRGRARGIRRRRAAAVASGAAVLVAAAVLPVALLVGGGSSPDTLPPAGDPTVSDTANPEVEASYPPGWIVDGEVRSSDGTAFTPKVPGELVRATRLGPDRWVVGSTGLDTRASIAVVDRTGTVLDRFPAASSSWATDDLGTAVAWASQDGSVLALTSDSTAPFVVNGSTGGQPPEILEVLPGCTVDGCGVALQLIGTFGIAGFDPDGLVSQGTDLLTLSDISPDGRLAAGYTVIDERSSRFCSAVVELETGTELWESCEASSFRFSPDGSTVLATDPYLDGLGQSYVQVLSADDGEPLSRYEGGTVFDYRWESDDSYLVSMQTNTGENLLLRVDVDGGEPEVLERVSGAPGDPEGMVRLGG